MIEIERVEHIAMAVREPGPVVALLETLFGFELRSESEQRDGRAFYLQVLAVPGSSNVEWEVLSPLGDGSYLDSFLDGPQGPGLHHVGFIVPNLARAVQQLRAVGIEPWGIEPRGWPDEPAAEPPHEVFIHPRHGGQGALFQFYEAHAGLTAEAPQPAVATRYEPVPPGPPAPTAPDPPTEAATATYLPAEAASSSLGIRAIDHVSHACPDRRQLAGWYETVFGMRSSYVSSELRGDPFLFETLELPGGRLRWEVIQPHGPGSFIGSYLERRGPSLHHVTFEVGDWEQALAACAAHEVRPFGHAAGEVDGALWREAFIHPRVTGGVLVQFFWEEQPGIWI